MFSPSLPLRLQSSVRKAIKTVLRVSYLSIKVSAWIKGADIGDIISDDVVLKNGTHRKSGLITEISSLPTALLTLYYLEQAMVSVQPKCSHPQTTHQISFYFIRKTWTLIWISAGVCSVGGKPLQTWFLWLCSKNLPRSTRFRESRSRSSVNPLDPSRSSSHLAPDLPVLQSFAFVSGDHPFPLCSSFLTLSFQVRPDKEMKSHARPRQSPWPQRPAPANAHGDCTSGPSWVHLGPFPCPFWPPVQRWLPGNWGVSSLPSSSCTGSFWLLRAVSISRHESHPSLPVNPLCRIHSFKSSHWALDFLSLYF